MRKAKVATRSIDGFVYRADASEIGGLRRSLHTDDRTMLVRNTGRSREVGTSSMEHGKEIRTAAKVDQSNRFSDIKQSLKDIDNEEAPARKLTRRERRRMKKEVLTKKQKRLRLAVKIVLVLVAIAALAIGGFLVYRALNASDSVLNGSLFNLLNEEPLKEDGNGRSNFLVLGTTDDDPNHAGNTLTDTMMVISISQTKKDAYMFSVPRDLYVDYGMACASGYRGKINNYFSCSNDGNDAKAEQARLAKTRSFVGDILGLDIQYAIHVNSIVVRDAVDAVGGIDVDIQGSGGAKGILDRNFDWDCNYTCYKVKYDNGVHHLDGGQAMYLAMARGDTAPTYGLSRSNFDREQNQQKILTALKVKATSTGTLTNLSAVTKLIDAFGDNFRTNIETKEIRTLISVANKTKAEDIHSVDFFTQDNMLYTTGTVGSAGSVVYPSEGIGNYSKIQKFIEKTLTSDPVVKEAPHITVLNGSNEAGVAQKLADSLEAKGFTVDAVDNAPDGSYGSIEIYQIDSSKTASAAKLKELYGVTLKTTAPPVSVTGETDFLIIIGNSSVLDSVKDS